MSNDRVTYRDIGWQSDTTEVTDGVHYLSTFSACTAFETEDGIVLVDSGLQELGPDLAARLREETTAPVHTAIYTHGHVDHVHGLPAFLTDQETAPRVVAHENVPARFDRYEETPAHNTALNARQFGGAAQAEDDLYRAEDTPFRQPDYPPDTLYDDELVLEVGGLTFEVHHARGETDDHSWVYCPEKEVLCSGDFFISMAPNCGNPQKVQRYPWEWADALREMAGKEPRHLCPGHGQQIVDDPDGIRERLLTSADYLDQIVEQTLAALEDGSPPHVDVVHAVDPPATDEPWLREIYDESEFIVRNVLRYYGGWWTGRPSELKPAPRAALAAEVASLAGGVDRLVARALDLAEDGGHRLAGHLADYALEAAPDDDAVQEAVVEVYEARAEDATSLMAANLYHSAAAYAEDGRPFR
ncbi:MAG: alkyl sulfatase dimerization domain-containing protein [Haloarculaceae archaeon]